MFITKLASCAREKAAALLSRPLLFLLRSSQMACLREINGFLNRPLCILPCLCLPRVITSGALTEAASWKLQKREAAVHPKGTTYPETAWLQMPAQSLKQPEPVTSPSLSVLICKP